MLPPRGSGLKRGLDLTSLGIGDGENSERKRMGEHVGLFVVAIICNQGSKDLIVFPFSGHLRFIYWAGHSGAHL